MAMATAITGIVVIATAIVKVAVTATDIIQELQTNIHSMGCCKMFHTFRSLAF
jgi:hypothetical protein